MGDEVAKRELPPAPDGAGPAGLALWTGILSTFGLPTHELFMLSEAVRVADRLHQLEALVDAEGLLILDPKRQIKIAHPALVEARQQRVALARLLVALRLPDLGSGRRPQHRGLRGAYGPRLVKGGGDGLGA